MKETVVNFPITKTNSKRKASNVFLTLSAFSFGGGILSILMGLVFIIVHAALEKDSLFDELSTILMIAAFPLLILGGHFMDKAGEKRK